MLVLGSVIEYTNGGTYDGLDSSHSGEWRTRVERKPIGPLAFRTTPSFIP